MPLNGWLAAFLRRYPMLSTCTSESATLSIPKRGEADIRKS